MHRSKLVVLLLSLIGLYCCSLPWVNQLYFGKTGSLTGLHFSEGIMCVIYFGLMAGTCFFTGRNACFSNKMAIGLTVAAIAPIALTVFKISSMAEKAGKIRSFNLDSENYVLNDAATGLYATTAIIAAIAACMIFMVIWSYRARLFQVGAVSTPKLATVTQ